MASLPREHRLSVLNEVICVLFVMPRNVNMWWKTRVDSVTLQENQSIRAIANVTFDSGTDTAGNYFAEEKGTMHFLQANTSTFLSTHTSFVSV